MQAHFGDLNCVKCCIDDFLIYGKADPEFVGTTNAIANHDEALKEVLKRCKNKGFTLNQKKCKFGVDQAKFYGTHISTKGFRP